MHLDPLLEMRDAPTGRKPYLKGTGLTAWEVHMIWTDHGRDTKRVLEGYPHLSEEGINACAAYIQAHPEQIPDLEPPPGNTPFVAKLDS